MSLPKVLAFVLAAAAIILSVADVAWFVSNPQQASVRIEGAGGALWFLLNAMGIPMMLAFAAFSLVQRERAGVEKVVEHSLIAVPLLVLMAVALVVAAFFILMVASLLYAFLAGWIVGLLPAGIVESDLLFGWIFFFFVAEFFFSVFRFILKTGMGSVKYYRDFFFGMIREQGPAGDAVAYVVAAGVVVASLKVAAVMLAAWFVFSGVGAAQFSIGMLPTIIASFVFTWVPLFILGKLTAKKGATN